MPRGRPVAQSFRLRGAALALVAMLLAETPAPAQDVTAAIRDLAGGDDFRLRVTSALILGKSHAPGARPALEVALSDPHPAVRAAAAAALAAYGDPGAIPALEKHTGDSSASVRAQVTSAIGALRKRVADPWENARYVVQLGDMKNRSGVRGEQPTGILRAAALTHAGSLPGAVVSDGADAHVLTEAASRKLPVLALDGSLQRLSQGQHESELRIMAQVEFSLRRMPSQSLKGTLSGAATTIGSTTALANPALIAQLENQAIDGAVESAMRGASQGFEQALK